MSISREVSRGPPRPQGMGWRVGVSIVTFFGSMIAVILWLFFAAGDFSVYQNVALVVVILLAFIAVMGATWASWGMRQTDWYGRTAQQAKELKALVAYKSKYGFTKGIAEFIANKMRENGLETVAVETDKVENPSEYDAFVIGSAVFFGKWMKEAHEFITRNQTLLAGRPVWLFSSGPTGTSLVDKKGNDLREASIPYDIADFKKIISPRDHHVFYGGFDARQHGLGVRLLRKSETIRKAMQEGDFRNWNEIGEWAMRIARELEGSKPASA